MIATAAWAGHAHGMSIPLAAGIEACLVNAPRCVHADLEAGASWTDWLLQRIPGADPVRITIRIDPGRYRLTRGWKIDGHLVPERVATLAIVGAGAGRTWLLGSAPLPELGSTMLGRVGSVTSVRLSARLAAAGDSQLPQRGAAGPVALFDDAGPWSLAAWPEAGWARLAPSAGVSAPSVVSIPGLDLRALREESGWWLWGFFRYGWYDEHLRVGVAADRPGLLSLMDAPAHGWQGGARVRVLNTRLGLVAPRRYVLGPAAQILQLTLADDDSLASVRVAVLTEPVLELRQLRRVSLRGMTVSEARADGVMIDRSSRVLIEDFSVADVGGRGIVVTNSTAVVISRSDVRRTGQGGVWLQGGDRQTLTASDNRIDHSRIETAGRWLRTGSAALTLSGVGVSAIANRIIASPHTAIFFAGNNHRIAGNVIEGAGLDTDDVGAIYGGADWTFQGNVIEGNTICNVRALGLPENHVGIYLDDMLSGTRVIDNLIVGTQRGIQIGGGRDNLVRGNLIVDTDTPIHADARALDWASGNVAAGGLLWQRRSAMPVSGKVWRDAYPALQSITLANAGEPSGNRVDGNWALASGRDELAPAMQRAGQVRVTRPLPAAPEIQHEARSLEPLMAKCRALDACRKYLP